MAAEDAEKPIEKSAFVLVEATTNCGLSRFLPVRLKMPFL